MSYSSEVLADSPVVYFRLGDSSGTAMADSSGNGRTGTYVNAPTKGVTGALSGDSDTAVTLTRTSSQYATFPTTGLPSGSSVYTLEAWVKPAVIDDSQGILSIGNFGSGSQSNALRLGGSAAAPQIVHYWWGNDVVVNVSPSLIAVGQWSHIVATYDGVFRRIYVNGVPVGGDTPSAPNVVLTSPTVGRTQSSELFSGTIDEVAIYPTALPRTRVRAHYAAGTGVADAEGYRGVILNDMPVGYWRLGEATGNPADSSGWAWSSSVQGTISRVAGLLTGDSDGAFDFNGSSTLVDISRSSTPTHQSITVDGLISLDANGKTQAILGRADEGSGNVMFKLVVTSGNQLQFVVKRGGVTYTVTGTTAFTVGTTYHVAGVFDAPAGTLKVYVNGALEGTTTGITGSWGSLPGALMGAGYNGAFYARFDGKLDEIAYFGTALTGTQIAAHYAAATGAAAATTGVVSAVASAPSLAVSGVAVASGQVSASAPAPAMSVAGLTGATGVVAASASAPAVTVAGVLPTTGTVAATASAPSLTVAGDVAGVVAGVVAAQASSPSLDVAGVITPPVTGAVSATAPAPSVSVTDNTLGATIAVGVTVEVGAVTLLNLVALPGVEVPVGVGLDAGDSTPVVPLPGVTVAVGMSLDARPVELRVTDPRHKRTQWRYVVTDLANKALGELVDIQHDPVADGINTPTTMRFTMAADDPARTLIESGGSLTRKCQVWAGNELLLWGPLLPDQQSDNGAAGYTVHDPSWWWRGGRRVIGRLPRKNLLRNGDFKNGLTYWTRGYDADSKPKAAPAVRVVSEDFLEDTDGLDPIRAAEITGVESVTESELSSNAVFWPNLATFRPGGKASIEAVANDMPTTAGLKVTVIGHTANDGTGNGLGLSKRRADAAAAIIHAKRPGAVITTKGVGYYDPKPGFPIDSQEQRRVVIQYDQTITGESKQWIKQTIEVTQPKTARYPLELTLAAMLKVADDWSVPDANMVSVRLVVRRKGAAKPLPWDEQLGQGESSISDTDPVDRWIGQSAQATVPADGRPYLVDAYLYAPAALARYTAVGLFPEEELFFWGTDQALIFKGIVEHIQDASMGHGDLGIDTRTPLTGIKRDRTYPFRDHMPADTALEEFAGLNRGMDYDTRMLADGRVILSTYYPQMGKHTPYVLAQGGNIANASPERSRDVASSIIMQAQDLGAYRAEAYAKDSRALGGLLLERVVTAEQETPLNELREAARQELAWGKLSTTGYWLDIDPESIDDVLANTGKGDTVRLILDAPVAVDALARIISRERHPDSLRLLVALDQEV